MPKQINFRLFLGWELQELEKETGLDENFKDLKLFRKLKHFGMTDAKRCDAPTGLSMEGFSTEVKISLWFDSHLEWDWKDGEGGSLHPSQGFVADLKLLVTRDSPVAKP